MDRDEALRLIREIFYGPTDTEVITSILDRLEFELPHTGFSDLIFHHPVELTPEQVLDEATKQADNYDKTLSAIRQLRSANVSASQASGSAAVLERFFPGCDPMELVRNGALTPEQVIKEAAHRWRSREIDAGRFCYPDLRPAAVVP